LEIKKPLEINGTGFLGWMAFHPTNGTNRARALKKTQSTDHNQSFGVILSSSVTKLLKEGALILFCRLSDAGHYLLCT